MPAALLSFLSLPESAEANAAAECARHVARKINHTRCYLLAAVRMRAQLLTVRRRQMERTCAAKNARVVAAHIGGLRPQKLIFASVYWNHCLP